jgi:outer membrane protein W
MKKRSIILAIAFIATLAYTASAQTFSIGPRVGVNFAKTENGNDVETKANTLMVLGITSTYSISEHTGIGVDLLYSGEGAEGGGDNDLALNYIRVPVMFQYFFRDLGDDFRPKIYAGLAPGFLVNAERGETEVIDNFNKFDLAGTAGLGFHYQLSPRGIWLNTDVRYLKGFSDITEAAPEINNQHWQISLGVSFGMDR